jgi:hypothetical protein
MLRKLHKLMKFSHDSSIINQCVESRVEDLTVLNEHLFEKVLNNAVDVASFASHVALDLLLSRINFDSVRASPCLIICLKTLRKDCFDQAQIKWLESCFSLKESRWPHKSVPQLIQLLIEAGAPVQGKNKYGRNVLTTFLSDCNMNMYSRNTCTGILSILITKGANVNESCGWGRTPSMWARYENRWSEWCEALERNDKKIDDVVHAENSEWLLGKDWYKSWRRRGLSSYGILSSDNEEESEEEADATSDSDEEFELSEEDRKWLEWHDSLVWF